MPPRFPEDGAVLNRSQWSDARSFVRRIVQSGGSFLVMAGMLGNVAGAAPSLTALERFSGSNESWSEVRTGLLLLGELNCVACHEASNGSHEEIFPRPGPNLEGLRSRVRSGWLETWLGNPHEVKPGTVMPDLLAGMKDVERRRVQEGLAAFLQSLADGEAREESIRDGNPEEGRELYRRIGCAACHGLPDAGNAALSLRNLGEKYTPAGLMQFLKDPLKVRPSGRMPRVPMSDEERAHVVAWLVGAEVSASRVSGAPDRDLVSFGREQFGRLGCAACHRVEVEGEPLVSEVRAAPLESLHGKGGEGCLGDGPRKNVPFYDLGGEQKQAVAAALKHLAGPEPAPVSERVHVRLAALNCLQCHRRDGLGGALEERDEFFHSTGEDLGEEGRLPPRLDGVGRKLTGEALVRTLEGKGAVRPYMTTRMPDFGGGTAALLAELLAEADHDPNEEPTPRDGEENQVGRNMWGRALVGTGGLNCITCHNLKGKKSLGIRAMDLAEAPKRLRAEWFRDYLIDPAAFRPGTRMPAFWPEGKPMLKGNGNTTARQIDSIWVYLNEIDQSRLPEGMEKSDRFELKPEKQPIVFRTFLEGAGLRAIAVGFPEGVHAAFDAGSCAWTILWKGRFLDAESTWEDRFTPLAEPLDENAVFLARQPRLHGADSGTRLRFGGYRLDRRGVPTMLYRWNGMQIEDRMEPLPQGRGLLQTLRVRGGSGQFVWRLPKPGGAGIPLRMRVVEPAGLSSRDSGGEWQLPLDMSGTDALTVRIEWTW